MITTWELPHRHVGRHVEIHDRLESTNTLALERGRDPSTDGLAFLAREQTAGRGQYGRSWQAPAGSSVLMSAILFPPPPLRRPALLTAWAAVSVCELIERTTRLPATIKWPNDVLVHGKKVCGILIEQRTSRPDEPEFFEGDGAPDPYSTAAVVGIGLNLLQPTSFFEQAQLPLAGSLFSLSGQTLDHDLVVRKLLSLMDTLYALLFAGHFAEIEEMWRQRLALLDAEVTLKLNTGRVRGRLRQIAFAGLELETASGETLYLKPETVRHVAIQEG